VTGLQAVAYHASSNQGGGWYGHVEILRIVSFRKRTVAGYAGSSRSTLANNQLVTLPRGALTRSRGPGGGFGLFRNSPSEVGTSG